MTGEMHQSEVTRDNYPELFALRDALKRRGIASQPHAFDQYQGPYLSVPGVCKVWYQPDNDDPGLWNIERHHSEWEVIGAEHVHKPTETAYQYGCFTVRLAVRRIASLASL